MSRVLVADDEPAVLEILSQVVEDLGHDVVRARDGKEALALIRSRPPDLVITDHMMPRLSGLDLIRELRSDPVLKHLRVILLSAALPHGSPEAQVFLAKPFELSDFEQRVEEVLSTVEQAAVPATQPPQPPEEGSAVMDWIARAARGPIATARLSLEAFERGVTGVRDPKNDEHLREVYRQLDRLEGFTRSLEDASRLFEGRLTVEPTAMDLRGLLGRAVEAFRVRNPGARLEAAPVSEAVTVRLDGARADQLLGELLSFAAARTQPGKRIALSVELTPLLATVHVQDSGVPMNEEEQNTLFDRMPRRGDDRAHAQDLGLFVAAQLARLQGGMLTVRSRPEDGATVSWSIPRA